MRVGLITLKMKELLGFQLHRIIIVFGRNNFVKMKIGIINSI